MNQRPPRRGAGRPFLPSGIARGTQSWRAELRRRIDPELGRSSHTIGASDEEDAAALFHELHAHKLELEVQNEDLRRAQTDSEQALARYLDLYHMAPVAHVSLDPMGVVLEANRAAVELLALTGEQLLLSKLRSVVVRADELILARHLDDLFARGGTATAELRVRRGDGQERVVRLDSVFVPGSADRTRCHSAIVDITYLVRRETALRRLASAVSDADDAVFVLDLAGRIQTWNRGARELFGLSEADAIGASFARMVPAHRHEWLAGLLDRLARGARIRSLDAERVASDGRPILVSMSAFSLPGDTGRPEAACFSEHDVTARRAAESAQAARELKLAAVMDAALDAIIIADERGRIEELNSVAETMFGCTAAEVHGTALSSLLQPAGAAPAGTDGDGHVDLPGKLRLAHAVRGRRGDGSAFPVRVSVGESRFVDRVYYCCVVRAVAGQAD